MTSTGDRPARLDRSIARDVLDAQESTGPIPILDSVGAQDLLRGARRIAIVGASPHPDRPSHGVMRYLLSQGYECVPINPGAETVLDVSAHPTLEAASGAIGRFDIVDVFRRAEFLPDIASSAVAVGAGALWLQLGVVSWEAAEIAHVAGLDVVMDRCTAIEHRAMRAGDHRSTRG